MTAADALSWKGYLVEQLQCTQKVIGCQTQAADCTAAELHAAMSQCVTIHALLSPGRLLAG